MPWYLWMLTSASCAVSLECLYKYGPNWGWPATMVMAAPAILLLQTGLYFGFRTGPTLLMAWGLYTSSACLARVSVSVWNGTASPGLLAGAALMVCGMLTMKLWG